MIHVAPLHDIIEHDQSTHLCQCNPVVDIKNDLVIHYAMDGRMQLAPEQIQPLLREHDEIL
jgi:hypothetical protein